MKILALLLLIVSLNANAESKFLDISKIVGDYYQYTVTAKKEFTVTKVTAALTAWSNPMTLVIRCDGKDLAEPTRKRYTNTQINVKQAFTASADINLRTCPSKSLEAYFETPGLEIIESAVVVKVNRDRLLDEDFVRMTNDQLDAMAQDLISYSGTMSQFAASEPTMHCIIESYKTRPGFAGIIQELTTNYFNTFGVRYTPGKFACPPVVSLEDRINTCTEKPTDRTQFCNTVKLYDLTKAWFVDRYLEAKSRKESLDEAAQALKEELSKIQDGLKDEVDSSDEILGIETDFESELLKHDIEVSI